MSDDLIERNIKLRDALAAAGVTIAQQAQHLDMARATLRYTIDDARRAMGAWPGAMDGYLSGIEARAHATLQRIGGGK